MLPGLRPRLLPASQERILWQACVLSRLPAGCRGQCPAQPVKLNPLFTAGGRDGAHAEPCPCVPHGLLLMARAVLVCGQCQPSEMIGSIRAKRCLSQYAKKKTQKTKNTTKKQKPTTNTKKAEPQTHNTTHFVQTTEM